jgi:hypothetical protein
VRHPCSGDADLRLLRLNSRLQACPPPGASLGAGVQGDSKRKERRKDAQEKNPQTRSRADFPGRACGRARSRGSGTAHAATVAASQAVAPAAAQAPVAAAQAVASADAESPALTPQCPIIVSRLTTYNPGCGTVTAKRLCFVGNQGNFEIPPIYAANGCIYRVWARPGRSRVELRGERGQLVEVGPGEVLVLSTGSFPGPLPGTRRAACFQAPGAAGTGHVDCRCAGNLRAPTPSIRRCLSSEPISS